VPGGRATQVRNRFVAADERSASARTFSATTGSRGPVRLRGRLRWRRSGRGCWSGRRSRRSSSRCRRSAVRTHRGG
jgi:hypothetical protein